MSSLDQSIEPSTLRGLSDEQKARLTEILDQYLSSLDDGVPPPREALLLEHADLAGPLAAYLDSLDELHNVAAGFASADEADVNPAAAATRDEKRLGDFRLLREVGHGGMGVVYEAHQISLDRRVALKVLPFAAVLDSKQIARFKNEAQAAAQLDHPNIVSVYAVGSDRGVHFFAMQLIDGQPLDRAIEELREHSGRATSPTNSADTSSDSELKAGSTNRSFLTEISPDRSSYFRTVMGLGIQAAEALHAAHEYGVVHRDVKPSNLLLDGEGKLWVTDFGLARCQSEKALTQTGDLVGTLRYMSPEQTLGQSALVDQRTDIYSLGATLYELLTLEPAFPGDDGPDLLRRLAEQDPRPLRDLQPKIPVDLQTVIHKAMARRREDRYTTAQEFADDLQRVLDGKPTIAKPPTIADRLAKWTRRHQGLVVSAAAVCLVAAVGLATSTVLVTGLKVRAEQSEQSAKHSEQSATRRFQKAQDVVEHLGLKLSGQLADIPGADRVRKELLLVTLQYYKDFAEEAKNDPALRGDLALTYETIATLTEGIGSTEEAIQSHEKAIALFEQLVDDDASNPEYRARLARCHNNLASLLACSGNADDARRAHDEAIRLQSELTESFPNDGRYTSDLASSYDNLGMLQSDTGDLEAAEASFRQAIRLQEQLLKTDSEAPEYLQELAASYNNLSTLYLEEQPRQAAEQCEKALMYQQKAAAAQPLELQYRSDLALTHNNLGAAYSRTEQLARAAGAYQRAIDIQCELVNAAPSQNSYQRDLAVSFNNLGLVQNELRRVVEAEELKEFADAGSHYRNAIEYQRRAHAGAPDISRYGEFLSKHYHNYGRVMRRLGRPDEAVRVALARRELWPGDPKRLVSVAEELALAGKLLEGKANAELTSEDCAAKAMDTLEQAIDAGLSSPADLAARDCFAALKKHRRFAELINH